MDLNRIELLVRVAEFGSFSRAASVMGVSQPALGRQVRKLEQECGVPLLYRHGRGVMPTPEGERLIGRTRPLVRDLEAAIDELRAERESPGGVVTLGLTPTLCRLLGMRLLEEIRARFPLLQLNVVVAYSGYVHEWLTNARLDLAVVHDARRAQHLMVEHIGDLELSLVSAATSLKPSERRQGSVRLARLAGLPLALPTRNHGLRRTVERAARAQGFELRIDYEVDSLELMLELVRNGKCHTTLGAPVVQDLVDSGALVARTIVDPHVTTRLMLARAAHRPVTRVVRTVEATLKALVAESLPGG